MFFSSESSSSEYFALDSFELGSFEFECVVLVVSLASNLPMLSLCELSDTSVESVKVEVANPLFLN